MCPYVHTFAAWLDRIFWGPISTDDQYRTPTGFRGFFIGQAMLEQHRPENLWTLNLLDLTPRAQVLEIGFGPGLLLRHMACRVKKGKVFGVDLSSIMVVMAGLRNLWPLITGQLQLRRGDALHLPHRKNSLDTIVSIHGIYFWMAPLGVIQECRRVLKPGGRLVLTFMPSSKWPEQGKGVTCHVFSEVEVCSLLEQGGFQNIRVVPGQDHFRECAVIGEA